MNKKFVLQYFQSVIKSNRVKINRGEKMSEINKKITKQGRHYKNDDPYGLEQLGDFLYERYSVISSNECTGLISAAPQNKKEKSNYKDIYDTTID